MRSVTTGLHLDPKCPPAARQGWIIAIVDCVACLELSLEKKPRSAISLWAGPSLSSALQLLDDLTCREGDVDG